MQWLFVKESLRSLAVALTFPGNETRRPQLPFQLVNTEGFCTWAHPLFIKRQEDVAMRETEIRFAARQPLEQNAGDTPRETHPRWRDERKLRVKEKRAKKRGRPTILADTHCRFQYIL